MDLNPNPFAPFEDKIDSSVPTVTLAIYRHIDETFVRPSDTAVNRCSAANYCVRRRWYQAHGHIGTPITPRKTINFMMGDIAEAVLLYNVSQALVGEGKIYKRVALGRRAGAVRMQGRLIPVYAQKTLSFKIRGGPEIRGHADGFGQRNSDGQWELIECKSAASYGFDSFKEDGPGDYLKQAHALMLTKEARKLGVKSVRFIYLRKDTGHLWDRLEHFDESIARRVIDEYKIAVSDQIPERPYGLIEESVRRKPTGRFKLPWQCGYCPHSATCWSDFNIDIEFKSDGFGMLKPVQVVTLKNGGSDAV